MKLTRKPVMILLAEDDDDDFALTRDALIESRLLNELRRVKDGEELMAYLHQNRVIGDQRTSPMPGLILLDLNMPKKGGRECLREIKGDSALKAIPVVVLTNSKAEEDVLRSYELGVNSFIKKPVTFEGLVEAVGVLGRYWLEIVEMPPLARSRGVP
jgi:two-component system, response regulator